MRLIAPTTRADFVAAVRTHLRGWPEWIGESDCPGFRAYAVQSICRALHVCCSGQQLSKSAASRWAIGAYPEWSPLIGSALAWREDPTQMIPVDRVRAFIDFALRESGV